ncbi:alpha/beta fold hydrolase [Actinomadura luteofluorescens]|uniref:Pimeloyl-ACP methyl ester carboxylesterase n=1 Tax=Actinomadura luteofluorescens TaxID=46163 RepID=A0A7Y9JET2_9ACTN|nr:alpha/beta hydrolase [Actinomadura luteofluorescens]NYD44589.1 pimeloyl-ACP methyl ester carboxylesterase [Actinomadura luteofluorescens]
MTPRHRTLRRPGCEIHYWTGGSGDGAPIVLTHGATLDHRTWEPQIEAFAARHRIVLWDVRGHGRSIPNRSAWSLRAAMDDLLAILDEEGVERAVLVGQSMGGNLSQEIVHHHPGRVSALVALGCAGNTLPLSRRERIQAAAVVRMLPWYPRGALIRQEARASARNPRVREYVRETAARMSRPDMVAVMASLVGALHPEPGYRIELPELLLRGEHDRLGNFRTSMPVWERRDPLACHLVVPDAAHLANQDNPDFFNGAVLRFLAEHGLDSPKGRHDDVES